MDDIEAEERTTLLRLSDFSIANCKMGKGGRSSGALYVHGVRVQKIGNSRVGWEERVIHR